MGLCRTLTSAILWPLAIYAALLAHAYIWHYWTTPAPLVAPQFPKSVSTSDRESIIKARQPIIHGIKEFIAGRGTVDFLNK